MKIQRKMRAVFLTGLCALFLISCGSAKGSAENKQGLSYYEEGKYEEAAEAFAEAVKRDETCAEYYVNEAMAQLGLSDFEGAKETLTEGLRTAPEDAGLYRAYGIVCYEEENYDEACIYFTSALNILGNKKGQGEIRTDIRLYKANAESKRGSYDAAIEDYSALISEDDKEAEYYFLRGKAYISGGNQEAALVDFEKVKELSSKEMDYYVEIYLVLEENGLSEKGKSYLETALTLEAKTAGDRRNRGAIQYLLGNYEEAKQEFFAIKEEERDANTWIYLGLAYEAVGDNEGANGAYEQALSMTESKASVYYQMALCQMRIENYSQALLNAQAGIAENEESLSRELAYIEAACYEYLGDFQTALQKFTSYKDTYGSNEKIDHEIAFLETRVQ